MSKTYEQLEPVIMALDDRISAKAETEQINALGTRVIGVENSIGNLSQLETTAKDDLVSAINETFTGLNGRLDSLGDVSELFIISNNLFNKDDADIVLNSEIAANGTISEKSDYFVSGFIPVEYGKTYTLSYPSRHYGTNSRVVTYNANKERIGYRNASARATESPYWITFTADAQSASYTNADVAYVRYTGYTTNIDSYRFVEGTEYSEFMPYGKKNSLRLMSRLQTRTSAMISKYLQATQHLSR